MVLSRLESIAHLSSTNLCPLTDVFLLEMLPYLMPADWRNQDEVEWRPEAFARHPKQEWFSLLWEYLRASCKDLSILQEWPLLPSAGGLLLRPVAVSKLIRGGVWSSNMESLLLKLGCQFLRTDLGVDHPQISYYVHEATAPGVLDAISAATLNHLLRLTQMFESVSPAERRELRDYLYNSKWYIGGQIKESHFRVFKALPIFEAYNGSGTAEMLFVDLGGPKRFLAPADMDEFLLGPEFLCASSDREAEVLTREMLKQLAFIPNAGGSLRIPRTLYDPRNVELRTLLDDKDSFPAGEFAASEVLEMLQGLGLRTTITPETVIQSARQTEALINSDPQAACARGRALLAYLELNANKWLPQVEDDSSKSFGRIFMKVSTSFQSSEANTITDAVLSKFWIELATICWCPVLMHPPHPHLPWPSVGQPVAPPKLVRLQADMWLASASMRILDGECRSSVLSLKLGWASGLSGSVLAAQLLELGKNHLVVEDRALGQALATAVPRIYTLLNNILATEEMEIVKALLEGSGWVWVGDGFASVQEVAFSGPLHLAPYLRVIPADLAAFKELLLELGVRETLTPTEFALVLANMAKDKCGAPLDARQLSAAIWLVQHLADLHLQLSPFVPDASSILTPASELVYNDAPWLSNSESSPNLIGQSSLKGPRFVHSKISSDVAERLGVCSLRRLLVAESADPMDLGLHEAAEAFGQHEALTTRLKHIVEMYADGPGILCELVQNADDAGASDVSFLLDKTQYGTSSVLSPRMAEWQGAALYCLNNSVFTARDLYAISRIGQDSKLEKPSAIGRFGLGFNSVYHFTDIPGFISGGNLVMFDPHACNLPGITPSHPGLKISFVGRGLLEQFPDQFRPYLLFGCDLQKPFPGTLFRFPLRNSSTAASSEIKQEVYSPEDVMSLFSSFQSSAAEALLFLRNVTSITVYVREDGGQEMQELYRIRRQGSESKDKHDIAHKQVYEFVRGDPQNPIDKEQFYRKLQRTADTQLPWHCGKVDISVRMAGLEKSESWLISNAIGGGSARDQSVALENRSRGFVPWSGIAAPLQPEHPARVGSENTSGTVGVSTTVGETVLDAKSGLSFEGRAFCFLPLPVKTGLPVHVNGYFELSSNRRDIWYGDDMSGGGKLRSNWNSCLLEDVAAPAYARLLAEAAKEIGPVQRFYTLWPIHTIGEPWNSLLRRLYLTVVELDLPVLHTAVGRGKWVSAKKAVFPDNRFSEAQELGKALAEAGLPLVDAPDPVVSKFREFCPSLRYLTPHLLRKSLAGRTRSLGNKRVLALALKYCLSDVEPLQEADKLPGLGLLPLANGTLGTFARAGAGERILVVSGEDYDLLHDAVAYMLVDPSIEEDVFLKLQKISERGLTNTSPLTGPILEDLLPRLVPPEWRGKNAVVWTPGLQGQPTLAWMELLWTFLNASCGELSSFSEWPLLPTSDGQLLRLTVRNSRVLRDDGWSENMAGVLQKAHCYLLRNDLTLRHPTLGEYVHDATATGVLNALLAAAGGNLRALAPLFKNASDGELRELRSFLCQSKWFASGVMAGLQIQVLRALPVFESYGTLSNGRRRFVDLPEGKRWFAPDGINEALLGENFVRAESLKEEEVLTKFLGVSKLSESLFYQNHMFNNISKYSPEVRVRAMLNVIHELPRLVEEDPSILAKLSQIPFVSTEGGAVETPGRLYDPRIPELQTLLNKQAFFPSNEFATVDVLDVLVQLGLRRSLGRKGLLDSARSVAMISSSDQEEAVRRGKALLAHLNDLEVVSESVANEHDDLLVKSGPTSEDRSFEEMLGVSESSSSSRAFSDKSTSATIFNSAKQSTGMSLDRKQASRTMRHPLSYKNDDEESESNFWTQLINISWCPVYIDAPEQGLPWPQPLQGPIAAPKVVRPKSLMWLVSATMRILDGECQSPTLLSNLGWSHRPNVSVLAAQLIELSKGFSLVSKTTAIKPKDSEEEGEEVDPRAGVTAILSREIPAIYQLLQEYVGSQDMMILQSMLEGIQWVWVGDGFVSPKELAFDSPAHFHPYLHIVPSEIAEYRTLLTTLGVREMFGAQDYADVLHRIAEDVRGAALSPDQLTFCLRVLEALAEILPPAGTSTSKHLMGMVLIPDSSGVLVSAKDLVYNDAPWLAKSVPGMRRLVHPDIDNDLADRLGAKSLRYLSLVDQEMTSNLPCLATNVISEVLSGYGDEELLLFDLLEIADCCKARKVHIVYDKREHPRQSLLQPNLGQFQGPALTVVFEGAVLTTEEVCNLQGYPPTKLRGQICDFGSGLLSVYSITDLPFIVSSGCLYLFDPSGQILAASLADGQAVPSGTPVGKAYSLTGTDLPQRFTDQFRPLRVSNTITLGQRDATIIRMPLRTAPVSENFGKELGDREVACILNKFKIHASTTMLFLNSVEDVCVTAWEEEETEPHELFSVRIDPARVALRNPFQEKKWRKFQLTNLFGGFNVASKIHSIDVLLTEDGKKTVDKWLVVQTLGSGHTRDIALDRKYLSYNLTPIGGVAAHITRNGLVPPLSNENYVMTPLPLPVAFGLPVTIVGQFIVSHRAGHRHLFHRLPNNEGQPTSSSTPTPVPDELAAAWNKELLACVRDSYVELLQELQRLRHEPSTSRADPPIGKGLDGTHGVPANRAYAHWPKSKALLPSLSKVKAGASYYAGIDWSCLAEWLIKPMYVRLAELPVWQLHGGTMTKASEGMFLAPPGIDRQGVAPPATVCDFLKAHYRVFVVPWELTKEMEAAGVAVKELTPKMLRTLLKSPTVAAAVQSVVTQVDLLEYCCADISFQEPPSAADSAPGDLPSSSSREPEGQTPVSNTNGTPVTVSGIRLRPGINWPEQFGSDNRGLPGVLDRGGDAVGLVAEFGRAIADIGRGVIGDSVQQFGVLSKAVELKGLQCPTGTSSMAKLGTVELLVGTKEQQSLLPGMAAKFVHPLCLERPLLAELFRHSTYQNTLRLKPFSSQLLATHLGVVLPKQWVARGSPLATVPWVPWEQSPTSQFKGPSSEWVQSFWKNVDASSSDELNLFTQWPLIPAVTSIPVLLRVGNRHLVFVPPVPHTTYVAPIATPTDLLTGDSTADTTNTLSLDCTRAFVEVERQHAWLLPLLRNCNVPVYDRRFLDCSVLQCCVPSEGQSLGQIVASKLLALQQAGQLVVSELALMPTDCDSLFSLFASCTYDSTVVTHAASIPAYSAEELIMLRSLPVYKTARGGYVAIDQRLHCVVPPTTFMQPDDEHCLQYFSLSEGGSFYHVLGISELTDYEVLARFALPGYETHSEREQERILSYVYSNWASLKLEDAVVAALKQTKFVRTGNDSTQSENAENNLCSPQELLDPENPLLKRVFAGEAGRFPGGQFATSGWLRILRDAGLRSATDAGLLLECARKVEELGQQSSHENGDDDVFEAESSSGLGEVSTEVWAVSGMLVETILANFASLFGTSFCEPLSRIACVPAERGILSGGAGRGKRILASYSEAVLLKDWSLAWTCAPVLARPSVVPPEFSWATLRLRSPPPFSVVLKHLKTVGKNGGEDVLARWPNGRGMKSVEDAFSEVLRYLSATWDGLSDADKGALQGVHFIPVANGTRLAMASALYARISMDLAPFVFELPSAFLAYVKVLGELGMQEAPSFESMKHLLLQLQQSCGYQRLNPNELRAVLRILQFICDKSNRLNLNGQQSSDDFTTDAVVPDDGARLVHARACVYVDAVGANLVGEIESARMKFVHPLVSEPLCIQLGVRKLSEVVVEELDENRSLEMTDIIGPVSRMSVAEKLRSRAFVEAAWGVVVEAGQTVPLLRQLSKEKIEQTLYSAADGLWFVRRLYTKFWLLPGRTDVTKRSPQSSNSMSIDDFGDVSKDVGHRVYEFIDKNRILIAEPPDYVSLTDLLAVVVSRLLGSPSCLPISALLKSPLGMETAVKRVLRLGSSQISDGKHGHQQQSGVPGMNVIAPDKALVQFHPLRPFHAGEIVAWRSDGDGEAQLLRYGRVVEDVRASAGQALYRLQVETGEGQFRFLLSSQVFSFKATAAANGFVTKVEDVPPQTGEEIRSSNNSNKQALVVPSPVTSLPGSSSQEQGQVRGAHNVSAQEVGRTVKDMLAAAGMPMTLDQHTLLERSLALQEQLAAADTALSIEQATGEGRCGTKRSRGGKNSMDLSGMPQFGGRHNGGTMRACALSQVFICSS
ncbi:hypothetical protein AXG93_606s1120 [Marchantia polymorpha subsp. ruderalis]|uniref:Sacsin/Nov domain-containing protein n=1 Tax=Marchantia polymorpha subsp. ruderalis TaxID=1480154 RepID=A0A176VKF4_MARPO|nr:hypothetical protein AXG93_606s1120 [Marchantia polymorpha subsp. ruderalis]